MIKNLIISGGGYHIFNILGIVYKLEEKNIYNIKNINSIYGVSAGSIIGSILCLNMDKNDVLDYTINRPWNKDINIEPENFLNLFNKNGLLDKKFIHTILNKLLLSNNLKPCINLLDFYKYSNIDLHILSLSCNNIKLIDFSHKTHPNLKLLDAIYMSSSIPFIFEPMYYEKSYMIDGAILKHFPYELCKCNNDEKLGILINKNYINIKENTNFLNLYTSFLNNLLYFHNSKNYEEYKKNKNIIILDVENSNKEMLFNLLNKKDIRKGEIEKGYNIVEEFIKDFK
tara:strand:+ start:1334 stop:2188 length:855 start_codon:yes stop_codon:yes gene_type:complete